MSRKLGPFLRERRTGPWHVLLFRCPGCGITHEVYLQRGDAGPVNAWDGNEDAPTIAQAVTTRVVERGHVCVVRVDQGRLHFMDECTHDLRGFVLPMERFRHVEDLPPLPKQEPPSLRARSAWRPA